MTATMAFLLSDFLLIIGASTLYTTGCWNYTLRVASTPPMRISLLK